MPRSSQWPSTGPWPSRCALHPLRVALEDRAGLVGQVGLVVLEVDVLQRPALAARVGDGEVLARARRRRRRCGCRGPLSTGCSRRRSRTARGRGRPRSPTAGAALLAAAGGEEQRGASRRAAARSAGGSDLGVIVSSVRSASSRAPVRLLVLAGARRPASCTLRPSRSATRDLPLAAAAAGEGQVAPAGRPGRDTRSSRAPA